MESGVSDWSLRTHKFSDVVRASGLGEIRSGPKKKENDFLISPPRILYFDIEVVGMEVKTYTLYPKNGIAPSRIVKDWAIISYAAYFEGEEDHFYSLYQRFAQDKRDDRQLIEGLHELMLQADIVVGHNSDRFDIKKFNTKAAKWGLMPIQEFISYDTLKIVKKYFSLSSNSLAFAAAYFQLENANSDHGKFPGDKLWHECMCGNMDAWAECEKYNIQDVRVTQELFKFLATFDSRINFQPFFQRPTCTCGSQTFYKDKKVFKKSGMFQGIRCTECHKPYVRKENLIDKDIRKGFVK
jgi:DNA polymerase elongation subunit (family B)